VSRDPIEAPCRTTFHAVHDDGPRDVQRIHWIVLHDEEASTAEGAARWFMDVRSGGSAHLCVDDSRCYRCLGNDRIPQGAPGANTNGFHIEQAGFAKWSAVVWRSHMGTLKRAAFKTALHCRRFGVPPVWVDARGLAAGQHGVTTHRQCSLAFGGDHSDPGPFWPRRLFMRLVRRYFAQLGL
jgi:hypothetical protein